jgi:hypothetical protein
MSTAPRMIDPAAAIRRLRAAEAAHSDALRRFTELGRRDRRRRAAYSAMIAAALAAIVLAWALA